MPANLTPDYHRAEQRFREARSVDDKIAALEEMLRVMPKHKGTDHLQADIRARIAKLRKEGSKKAARSSFSYVIPREGAGQVALAGPPNSGKSSLVRALTRATPAVADYPFTTREPTPGMAPYEDIAFQVIDLPPLAEEHAEPWVFDLVRRADLVWVVLDGREALDGFEEVKMLLEARGIGLHSVHEVQPQEGPPSRAAKKAMLVLTRADRPETGESAEVVDDLLERRWPVVAVSSTTGSGLDELKRRTFAALDILRVYTKEPGKEADRRAPFTVPRGATVADLAARIHKDLLAHLKFARVWGSGAFDGQTVQRDHVLAEGDVVEIHA
jgi:hypothetical protein